MTEKRVSSVPSDREYEKYEGARRGWREARPVIIVFVLVALLIVGGKMFFAGIG